MDTQQQTALGKVLTNHEMRFGSKFRPSKEFYAEKGINRIRFWQIVKGKKDILAKEVRVLAEFFGVEETDLY